jgi:HEPN domain-containing protein
MAPDPERVADTRSWLVKAQDDLRAIDALLAADEPLPGVAAYHAQQAAEKSLKAFLYWNDVAFRKTHELDELGRVVTEIDADLEDAVDAAVDLTPFAWRFRYPGEPLDPSVEEIAEAAKRAAALHSAILERLPAQARPS